MWRAPGQFDGQRERQIGELRVVKRGVRAARIVPIACACGNFTSSKIRLQRLQARIHADDIVRIRAACAVNAQYAHFFGEFVAVRGD